MADTEGRRVKQARKAYEKEVINADRIAAKLESLTPEDNAYLRVKRDLAQQIAQRDFARAQWLRAKAKADGR